MKSAPERFYGLESKPDLIVKWDDALAAKAMVEAVEPDNHGDFFETRNSMLPTKRYMGPPEEKVCLILLNSFKKYADKTDAKVQCQCKVKQCAIETKGDSRNCDEGGSICPDGVKVE
ncbi:unnamed protein product [Haemonchus placei]|uniref:AWS domain-containing protein n=1 Tax=Haemonchus placei TaxID=6290 RepID=A0A0N4X694_HAEPC|nr:unnamed protein product [Haemonchus placei]